MWLHSKTLKRHSAPSLFSCLAAIFSCVLGERPHLEKFTEACSNPRPLQHSTRDPGSPAAPSKKSGPRPEAAFSTLDPPVRPFVTLTPPALVGSEESFLLLLTGPSSWLPSKMSPHSCTVVISAPLAPWRPGAGFHARGVLRDLHSATRDLNHGLRRPKSSCFVDLAFSG